MDRALERRLLDLGGTIRCALPGVAVAMWRQCLSTGIEQVLKYCS